jgi:hypothetical protein
VLMPSKGLGVASNHSDIKLAVNVRGVERSLESNQRNGQILWIAGPPDHAAPSVWLVGLITS